MSGLAEIYYSLKIYGSIRKLLHKPVGKIGKLISVKYDIEKLADDYFRNLIKVGTIIKIGGFLSSYCHWASNLTFCIINNRIEFLGTENFIKDGKNAVQTRVKQYGSRLSNIPIQKFNPLLNETEGKTYIYFLYPKFFTSFLHNEPIVSPNGEIDIKEINIEKQHQPIPVLLSENQAMNFSEVYVNLTGVIKHLDSNLQSIFNTNLNPLIRKHQYKFNRPYSNKPIGFCIDCRSEKNSDIKELSRPKKLDALIYVQSHFYNTNIDKEFEQIIDNSFNKIYKIKMSIKSVDTINEIKHFPWNNNIAYSVYKNYIAGFYMNVDLVNQSTMKTDLIRLQYLYENFWKSITREYNSMGYNAKFSLDFLFDFSRELMFHKNGVLTSPDIQKIIGNDKDAFKTIDWLNL